jgi:hypothetical protein
MRPSKVPSAWANALMLASAMALLSFLSFNMCNTRFVVVFVVKVPTH